MLLFSKVFPSFPKLRIKLLCCCCPTAALHCGGTCVQSPQLSLWYVLCSMHVPECGGVSLTAIIWREKPREDVELDYHHPISSARPQPFSLLCLHLRVLSLQKLCLLLMIGLQTRHQIAPFADFEMIPLFVASHPPSTAHTALWYTPSIPPSIKDFTLPLSPSDFTFSVLKLKESARCVQDGLCVSDPQSHHFGPVLEKKGERPLLCCCET